VPSTETPPVLKNDRGLIWKQGQKIPHGGIWLI